MTGLNVETQAEPLDDTISIEIFMQVNAIDSVACQFIKSIAFLAIDKEALRERLVHRVPRHFIQGISHLEKSGYHTYTIYNRVLLCIVSRKTKAHPLTMSGLFRLQFM
jgi:hypothetical protein